MAKKLRIALLLFVLVTVAVGAWQERQRTTSWDRALDVVVFPINGDGRAATAEYLRSLSDDSFSSIESFLRREADHYRLALQTPIDMHLGPAVAALPPPAPAGGVALDAIAWTLKLRYWAWRHGEHPVLSPDVKIYAVYFDPVTTPRVAHSVGLQKGLIGIANLFAVDRMTEENNVVIAHELLHTLGATDKYDPATGQPRYPDGYAEPQLEPRHPQRFAEIMGGRIALSESRSDTPQALDSAVVGPVTAREIRWLR
jgi:hypothetical protein